MLCKIVGIPLQVGASQLGCEMGPSAIRVAGLSEALRELGHEVMDLGNIAPPEPGQRAHPNAAVRALHEVSGWIQSAASTAFEFSSSGMPIFLGGDHAIAAGTVSGMARRAAAKGRPSSFSGSMPIRTFTRLRPLTAEIFMGRPSPIIPVKKDLRAIFLTSMFGSIRRTCA